MARRPYTVEQSPPHKPRTFETPGAAIGFATVAAMLGPIGTEVRVYGLWHSKLREVLIIKHGMHFTLVTNFQNWGPKDAD